MAQKQINLLINQTELILNEAKGLKGKGTQVRNSSYAEYLYFNKNIDLLIQQFNLIAKKVNGMLKEESIDEEIKEIPQIKPEMDEVHIEHIVYNTDGYLLRLIFGCSQILTFIREGVVLPEVTLNKLDSLIEELKGMEKSIAQNIYSHLVLATESFEKGCFLGSSLISGKILITSLNMIDGKDINDRIEELKKYNLVREKDGEDSLIKANHYGRNLTTHDLKIVPSSSEAISYLGEAIKIAKLVSEYNQKKNDNSITKEEIVPS